MHLAKLNPKTHHSNRLLNSLTILGVLITCITLPFTQGLTINIGWPLKIYEVILVGVLGLWIFGEFKIPLHHKLHKIQKIALLFSVWLIISCVLNTIINFENIFFSTQASRFGPVGDMATKLIYALIVMLSFVVATQIATIHSKKMIDLWLIGALFSASYSWYCFIFSALGKTVLLLPGITKPQFINTIFGDIGIIRNGTFLEGNFAALYYILSLSLALHLNKPKIAAYIASAILTTVSTLGIVLTAIYLIYVFARWTLHLPIIKQIIITLISVSTLIPVSIAVITSPIFQIIIIEKLTATTDSSPWALSREERLGQAYTGIKMFISNPITGVGLGQYGHRYEEYREHTAVLTRDIGNKKRIANNVYVELLAETGLFGLTIFLTILIAIGKRLITSEHYHLKLGFSALIVYFVAFPTFSVMFIWFFLAIVLAISTSNPHRELEPTYA